ncbi:hypothetical protein UU5_19813, partial [Rhodanobacter sp. 115]
FLSCLRGSELVQATANAAATFLSCLRGSEREADCRGDVRDISELPARQRTSASQTVVSTDNF